jgi:hypothetical protein
MSKGVVLSLYDYTGEALKPWAEKGYCCYAFDIQHPVEGFKKGGICYRHSDLHDPEALNDIRKEFADKNVIFGMGFPVCTDLAVSGAAHFRRKAAVNPSFQREAVRYVKMCDELLGSMAISYFIENPVSVLATRWRRPDYSYQPYEYGGYIALRDAPHPRWPEYIAPRDAYSKKTCLWTGKGFVMPEKVAVAVQNPSQHALQYRKLGGKSQRTKDIRSATPRGFAMAICEANDPNPC